jgi:hypothetical protein
MSRDEDLTDPIVLVPKTRWGWRKFCDVDAEILVHSSLIILGIYSAVSVGRVLLHVVECSKRKTLSRRLERFWKFRGRFAKQALTFYAIETIKLVLTLIDKSSKSYHLRPSSDPDRKSAVKDRDLHPGRGQRSEPMYCPTISVIVILVPGIERKP